MPLDAAGEEVRTVRSIDEFITEWKRAEETGDTSALNALFADDFVDEWIRAEKEHDTVALGELLADDFVGVGPHGRALTKPAWLAAANSSRRSLERFDLDEAITRVHGDCVLVSARLNEGGEANSCSTPDARATLVIVDDGSKWKLAGVHLSYVADAPVR
jgi:ketosteroid isomerase-like protein